MATGMQATYAASPRVAPRVIYTSAAPVTYAAMPREMTAPQPAAPRVIYTSAAPATYAAMPREMTAPQLAGYGRVTTAPAVYVTPITLKEVEENQAKWANAIKTISATYARRGDYVQEAAAAAGELYGYGHSNVLFKPTKATAHPFRPTPEEAMSYFVGAEAMNNNKFKGEDGGFAINGGKGWKEVVFKNHQIQLHGDTAIAMGTYDFTCATTGDVATVEYTFGYKRNKDGKARIFLHHSSVPYSAAPAAAGPKLIAQMIPGARAIGA